MSAGHHQFRGEHHFVPRLSLKHFTNPAGRVCVYRTLVSRSGIPVWDEKAPRSIARIENLYTRTVRGQNSDEIETWLARDIEQPASEAIERIVLGARMSLHHWDALIRFVAAQIVRTPAFLARHYPDWCKRMPGIVDSVLEELPSRSHVPRQSEQQNERFAGDLFREHVPVKIFTRPAQEPGMAEVKVKILMGRGYWHFVMRHVLANTAEVLRNHRWSVLKPCDGLTWFTTDDPVMALYRSADGSYGFGAGWGRRGSEIFLPVSPSHLLYTTVGERPLLRGTTLDRARTEILRKFIAEHAHQHIFAASRDEEIPRLHPRVVSESRYRQEQQIWKTFAMEQTKVEAEWAKSA